MLQGCIADMLFLRISCNQMRLSLTAPQITQKVIGYMVSKMKMPEPQPRSIVTGFIPKLKRWQTG